jgi:hypothetical protein
LIDGGAIVFAQVKSSTFYSTYDARELVKNRKYKGIDFAYGGVVMRCCFRSFRSGKAAVGRQRRKVGLGGRSEKTKSISYGCRIETTGDDAFKVADFLDWLAQKAIKQIESGKGAVVRQRHKVGRRLYIEYAQDGFTGRLEVDAMLQGRIR